MWFVGGLLKPRDGYPLVLLLSWRTQMSVLGLLPTECTIRKNNIIPSSCADDAQLKLLVKVKTCLNVQLNRAYDCGPTQVRKSISTGQIS